MPGRDPPRAPGREPAATGAPIVQLCTFRIGGDDFAVDVMRVREIIHPLPITPVPRAPESVEGVVRLRGEVIPVLDVRERLGLPASAPTRRTRFLVVNVARRRVGLVVDEVSDVIRIPRDEIRPAPPLGDDRGPRFFLGVCGGDGATSRGRRSGSGRLRLLLNVKALLDPAVPGDAEIARAQADASREAAPARRADGGSPGEGPR